MFVYPIKKLNDLEKFKRYVKSHYSFKHYALVIVGINVGLRIGDLVSLRWDELLDNMDKLRELYNIKEHKTNKHRKIFFNENVRTVLYALRSLYPNDIYVFQSQSLYYYNHGPHPWSEEYPHKFITEAGRALEFPFNVGTHTLRKTFAYHAIITRQFSLTEVQVLLCHSHPNITLRYLALDFDDLKKVYMNINL